MCVRITWTSLGRAVARTGVRPLSRGRPRLGGAPLDSRRSQRSRLGYGRGRPDSSVRAGVRRRHRAARAAGTRPHGRERRAKKSRKSSRHARDTIVMRLSKIEYGQIYGARRPPGTSEQQHRRETEHSRARLASRKMRHRAPRASPSPPSARGALAHAQHLHAAIKRVSHTRTPIHLPSHPSPRARTHRARRYTARCRMLWLPLYLQYRARGGLWAGTHTHAPSLLSPLLTHIHTPRLPPCHMRICTTAEPPSIRLHLSSTRSLGHGASSNQQHR